MVWGTEEEVCCPQGAVTKQFMEGNRKDNVFSKGMNHDFGYFIGKPNGNR